MKKVCNLSNDSCMYVVWCCMQMCSYSVVSDELICIISGKSKPPLSRPKRYVPGSSSSAPKKPRFNFGECLLYQ